MGARESTTQHFRLVFVCSQQAYHFVASQIHIQLWMSSCFAVILFRQHDLFAYTHAKRARDRQQTDTHTHRSKLKHSTASQTMKQNKTENEKQEQNKRIISLLLCFICWCLWPANFIEMAKASLPSSTLSFHCCFYSVDFLAVFQLTFFTVRWYDGTFACAHIAYCYIFDKSD